MIMMMVMMMTGVAFILFFSCEKGLHDEEDDKDDINLLFLLNSIPAIVVPTKMMMSRTP